MIKGILFDLDGTLVDSFKSIVIAFNEALESMGAEPRKEEELIPWIGIPYEVTIGQFMPEIANDSESIKKANITFNLVREEVTDQYTKARDGVLDLLTYLKSKQMKIGIVTTTHRELSIKILKSTKIIKFVDVLMTRDDVSKLKPDPEPIFMALKQLNLQRDECIMIGDHPNDIIAAKKAGVKVIAVINAHNKEELQKHNPDWILSDIRDVKKII